MKTFSIAKQSTLFPQISLDQDILIEASAGTGKTFSIVELVFELLVEKQIPLRNILLVTFTEKATLELKERIRRQLLYFIQQSQSTEVGLPTHPEGYWEITAEKFLLLQTALLDFDSVSIHTIHGFCNGVLKEFAFESGQLMNQEQIPDSQTFPLFFRDFLRKKLSSSTESLLELYLENTQYDAPFGQLEKEMYELLYQRGQFIPEIPEIYEIRKELEPVFLSFLDIPTIHAFLHEDDEFPLDELLKNVVAQNKVNKALKANETLKYTLRQYHLHQDWQFTWYSLLEVPFAALQPAKKHWNSLTEENKKIFIQLEELSKIRSRILAIYFLVQGTTAPENRGAWMRIALIMHWLPEVQREFAEYKTNHGYFDFNDMLLHVEAHLQQKNSSLTQSLRQKYQYAIIDEFQDTDSVQWNIFKTLFFDSPHHSLIVIGDPKQAIYSFRGADIYTYLEAKRQIQQKSAHALYHLSTNFRSTPTLVQGINHLFEHSSLFANEIKYQTVRAAKAHTPLPAESKYKSIHLLQLLTPFTLTNKDLNTKHEMIQKYKTQLTPLLGKTWYGVTAMQREIATTLGEIEVSDVHALLKKMAAMDMDFVRHTLAHQIAQEIQLLREQPSHFQPGDSASSPLRESDICILFRSKAEGVFMAKYLRQHHIPYSFYHQTELFQSAQAQEIYLCLQAIVEPSSTSAIRRALLTRFFDYSLEELEQPMAESLSVIRQWFFEWKELAEQKRYAELFDTILTQTKVIERELFCTGDERSTTNFEHIFEILYFTCTEKQYTLSELLWEFKRWMEEPEILGEENTLRLESEKQAVQLMTMHTSKGLEFPIVFVFGGFSTPRAHSSWKVYHTETGKRVIDLVHKDPPAYRKEKIEEDQRILYVVLTRAKTRLYLPYFEENPAEVDGTYFTSKGGAYATLFPSLHSLFSQKEKLFSQGVLSYSQVRPKESLVAQELESQDNLTLNRDSLPLKKFYEFVLPATLQPQRLQQRKGTSVFSFTQLQRYSTRSHALSYRVDVSSPVSSTAEKEEIEPEELSPLKLEEESNPALPLGATTGTFLHRILEQLDYSSVLAFSSAQEWFASKKVNAMFTQILSSFDLPPQMLEPSAALVWQVLQTPISLENQTFVLSQCHELIHEMEFYFTLNHSAWNPTVLEQSELHKQQEGLFTGSIDLLFRFANKIYFLDWKSNRLENYAFSTLEMVVKEKYQLQVMIYTVAVVRWLGIQSEEAYQERFGGMIYYFLRGMLEEEAGVFYQKPSWEEVSHYQHILNQSLS